MFEISNYFQPLLQPLRGPLIRTWRYDAAKLYFFSLYKTPIIYYCNFLSQPEQRHDQPQQPDKQQCFDKESDKTADKGER